ncbi:MAG TPA: helix-turn-helix domain-containing protein [Candidatus Barnesiella merdipullorum]|nr:helix-turn-helix domain-containing protein [Candidatus Barnesiella merdipullorum]
MVSLETFIALYRLLCEPDKAIVERYIQGKSIAEIARELDCSQSVVSETIYRFRQQLKKERHPPI